MTERKCTGACWHCITTTCEFYGDLICFCCYDEQRYIGFRDDVEAGECECIHPELFAEDANE